MLLPKQEKQRMGFSFLFLICFMLKAVADVGAVDECSRVTSCKPHGGPPVRFPFRLRDLHPPHCGYPHPGFELSCTPSNLTVLELPRSVQLQVKHINYAAQKIQLVTLPQDDCIPRLFRNLNLSTAPFQFDRSSSYLGDFTLFNCSLPSEPYRDNTIPCLSDSGHRVQAVDSRYRLSSLSLASCRKTDVLTSIPSYLMQNIDDPNYNDVHLNWYSPSCGGCERNGRGCKLKSRDSDQTECYELPEHSRDARRKLLISSLVVCSFLLVVSAIGVYYVHRSYKLKKEHEFKIKQFLEDYKALKSTRYSYSDVKRITNGFKEKLGQGGYGTVYKGQLSNNVLVAVKILSNISAGNGEEFINEVGSMGRIHHVNVARLVGFCADGSNRALVYEFLPNKSLDKYIFSENGKSSALGWEKLQDIAQGIAKGIEYLHHGCDQQILHFDIKPHNILLDHNFNPKISDFGLAKLCSKEKSVVTMTAARGTMGYIAPEVVSRNFGKASSKSDVYSFGMLLLEMAGGRKIVETRGEKGREVPIPGGVEIEEEGDAKIASKMAKVALWCIQWYPVDRPSVKVVVQMLEGEGENVKMPPNPFASAESFGASAIRPAKSLHMELDIITEAE